MVKILFVCRYNRFRSKTAEAIFNKLNKNPSNEARSAGMIRGGPISPAIINAAKKSGYQIKGEPQGLSTELMKWHDTTVIVADDVPKAVFKDNEKYGRRTLFWRISDTTGENIEAMQPTILEIEKRVIALLKKLK